MGPAQALQTLFEGFQQTSSLPLPDELAQLYGALPMKLREDGPLVLGNFVSTLDGVVSFDAGRSGGGPISGSSGQDRMVMGLLRAVADAVIEGAGTLRTAPQSLLTAKDIYPDLEQAYAELRRRLGKAGTPVNVIVSESGDLDLGMRIFRSAEVAVIILTGAEGAKKLARKTMPARVEVRRVPGEGRLAAAALLESLALPARSILLTEGGPRLLGSFLKGHRLHELFLTLAPQVAGRDSSSRRPGLVSDQTFSPEDPRWADLVGVKKGHNHLFLRYELKREQEAP